MNLNTLDKRNIKICAIGYCTNLCKNKGFRNGKVWRGKYCIKHSKKSSVWYPSLEFNNSKCSKCGWNKSYCDRHRIIREKGYTKGNVIILCPNCHRLEDSKKTI